MLVVKYLMTQFDDLFDELPKYLPLWEIIDKFHVTEELVRKSLILSLDLRYNM